MASTAAETTEKQGYSGFERTMFFLTPVLFALLVGLMLLLVFNEDVRNSALKIGHEIPFLSGVLPKPAVDPVVDETDPSKQEQPSLVDELNQRILELEGLLSTAQTQQAEVTASQAEKEKLISQLEAEVSRLQTISEQKLLDDEEYTARIQELSNMYAQAMPSKAAPIIQNLELDEMALILSNIKLESRVKILEKMNPKVAADVTMIMKDDRSVKDMQIAALQARVEALQALKPEQTGSLLSRDELQSTFTAMAPKSAAQVLLKMASVSESKVLLILGAVDNQSRSAIIAEMTTADEAATAKLVAKLTPAK